MIYQYPSVSKSNRLHGVIFQFSFINVRYILWISSKLIGIDKAHITLVIS